MKAAILPKASCPTRATCIREFIVKCQDRGLPLHSSQLVHQQVKAYSILFWSELKAKGHTPPEIGRFLATAESKVNKLLYATKIHQNLANKHLQAVETFFKKYESDNRLIGLMRKKNRTLALPEPSDMEILAQALTLPNLFFATTDDHFYVLKDELEQRFGFVLVHDDNALQKLRAWGWN